jgi:hypothetical protein
MPHGYLRTNNAAGVMYALGGELRRRDHDIYGV